MAWHWACEYISALYFTIFFRQMIYTAIRTTNDELFVGMRDGKFHIPTLDENTHYRSSVEGFYGAWCQDRADKIGVFFSDPVDPLCTFSTDVFKGALIKIPKNIAALVIRNSGNEILSTLLAFKKDPVGAENLNFEIIAKPLSNAEHCTLLDYTNSVRVEARSIFGNNAYPVDHFDDVVFDPK